MIKIYRKSENRSLSNHFEQREFDCQCDNKACYSTIINEDLIDNLELTRADFGGPIFVTCGNRCQLHNKELKEMLGDKVADQSSHILGDAADLTCADTEKNLDSLERSARKYFKFVKRYKTYIHVDNRLLKEK